VKLRLAIVLVLTGVFLALALRGLELDAALRTLRAVDWRAVVPMMGAYVVVHSLRSLRLGLLLAAEGRPRLRFHRLFLISSVGFLAINVLPLRLGEAVRPYLLVEREGVALGDALAAILLERLVDVIMLLGMLLTVGLLVELPPGGVVVAGVELVSAGQRALGLAALGGAAGLAGAVFIGEPLIGALERIPVVGRLAPLARRFRAGLVGLLRDPRRAALVGLLSAGTWGFTLAAVRALLGGFPGMPTAPAAVLTTWTFTLLGMTLVPTPGFFGPYELACSSALQLWGVESAAAQSFGLVLHLGQLAFTLCIGGIGLLVEGLSLRALVRPPLGAPPA
jgi:uncharacterized membrane protein YbhN (UPF0104 family)